MTTSSTLPTPVEAGPVAHSLAGLRALVTVATFPLITPIEAVMVPLSAKMVSEAQVT